MDGSLSWAGWGSGTSGSAKALREGLGSDESGRGESPFVCVWRLSLCQQVALCPWSGPHWAGGLRGGAAVLAFPGSLQTTDKVHLLMPGSPAPSLPGKLVERFSVPLQVIPAVHPGETVFLPRRHPWHMDSSTADTRPTGCSSDAVRLDQAPPSGNPVARTTPGGRRRLCSASVGEGPAFQGAQYTHVCLWYCLH